jgi:hypothetical protein
MLQHERLDDARMARIGSAFGRCAWRRMTARAVACRLVEAIDGTGTASDDNRVWIVERALSVCHWRGLTMTPLACQAAAALDVWETSCQRLEIELAWLLETSR